MLLTNPQKQQAKSTKLCCALLRTMGWKRMMIKGKVSKMLFQWPKKCETSGFNRETQVCKDMTRLWHKQNITNKCKSSKTLLRA